MQKNILLNENVQFCSWTAGILYYRSYKMKSLHAFKIKKEV